MFRTAPLIQSTIWLRSYTPSGIIALPSYRLGPSMARNRKIGYASGCTPLSSTLAAPNAGPPASSSPPAGPSTVMLILCSGGWRSTPTGTVSATPPGPVATTVPLYRPRAASAAGASVTVAVAVPPAGTGTVLSAGGAPARARLPAAARPGGGGGGG